MDHSILESIKSILETNRCIESGRQFTVAYEGSAQDYLSSCIASVVLKHFDTKASEREILSVFPLQQPSGKITNPKSNFMEPPLLAYSAFDVFSKSKNVAFLENIFTRLDKYYKWIAAERDINNKHILSTIHPTESWQDCQKDTDAEIRESYGMCGSDRKFLEKGLYDSKDVVFNCIYLSGLESMQEICKTLNKNGSYYKREHGYVKEAVNKYLYDKPRNMFLPSTKNHKAEITSDIFFPLFSKTLSKPQALNLVQKHLFDEKEFWTAHPIPKIPFSSKHFHSSSSGASSMLINWFVFKGLLNYGLIEAAEDLYGKSVGLFEKGLWEKYDSMTGKGLGKENHINSTLVLDMGYLL